MAWSELLVDLFFVAAYFQMDAVGLDYFLLFSVFWQHWFSVSIYALTRKTTDDTLSGKVFRFTHLYLLGVMTLAQPFVFDVDGAGPVVFGVANALSRLTRMVQWRENRKMQLSHLVNGILHVALCFLPAVGRRVVLGLTVVVDWTAIATVPLHFSPVHLQEHFATFSSILLGDTLLGTVVAASAHDPMSKLVESSITFVIVFALWWIYFDDLDASIFQNGRVMLFSWMFFHFSFHYFLTYGGKLLADLIVADVAVPAVDLKGDTGVNTLFIMFAMMLLQSSFLKMVQLFAGSEHRPIVVFTRCANGGILFIIGVLPFEMSPLIMYILVCVILCVQVTIDLCNAE